MVSTLEVSRAIPDSIVEQTSKEPNLAVLSPHEYLWDFGKEAKTAKESVALKTMIFRPDTIGEATLEIFQQTPSAIQKTLYVDWCSLLTTNGQEIDAINRFIPRLTGHVRKSRAQQDELFFKLTDIGVDLVYTNPPKHIGQRFLPALGRNHMKGGSIDEDVFYFGGVNLQQFNIEGMADFMVKFTGPVAKKLTQELEKIHTQPIEDDYAVPLDEHSTLLVDTGISGRSIILDIGVDLVQKESDSVYTASLFVPDNPMAKALHQAGENGAYVEAITAISGLPKPLPVSLEGAHWVINALNLVWLKASGYQIPIHYNPFRDIHAKLVIGGEKWAIFGSNNMSKKGVDAGTREWAILTYNPILVKNLLSMYRDIRQDNNPAIQDIF